MNTHPPIFIPFGYKNGATIDVVDLLVGFGEVILRFFGLFLLIGPFGHLKYFNSRTCTRGTKVAGEQWT
jgi:hypothetical protein